MASVGVEFNTPSLERVFNQTVDYYRKAETKLAAKAAEKKKPRKEVPWAVYPIYENNMPIRPWGLGAKDGWRHLVPSIWTNSANSRSVQEDRPKDKDGPR